MIFKKENYFFKIKEKKVLFPNEMLKTYTVTVSSHKTLYAEEKNLEFLLAIMMVLEFPPRLSFNNQVKTESL